MWPNPDLVTFTEEILNGKLHILCSVNHQIQLHVSVSNCSRSTEAFDLIKTVET